MSIFSRKGSTLSAAGSPKWPWAFIRMRVPALVKQKVTIIFQCSLVNVFKALGNCPFPGEVPDSHNLAHSTWIWFLLVDDLRGKCVFVHTSPLATMMFVSPRRSFNSCGNDIIMKCTTNMPSHKSGTTVACCSASCILLHVCMFSCAAQWFSSSYSQRPLLLKPHRRQPLLVFYRLLLGHHKLSIMHLQQDEPQKESSLQRKKKSHTEVA